MMKFHQIVIRSKINKNKDVDNITSAIEFKKLKCIQKWLMKTKALYPVDYVDVYISMYSLLYALFRRFLKIYIMRIMTLITQLKI